jgi:hypothetical protein
MQRYIFYLSVSWCAVAGMEWRCRRNGAALSPEWSGAVAGMEWRCRLQGGHSLRRCSTGDMHFVVVGAIFPVLNVAHIVILWHFPGRCSTTNQLCAVFCGIFAVLHLSMERPCRRRPSRACLFRTCQTDLQVVTHCTDLQAISTAKLLGSHGRALPPKAKQSLPVPYLPNRFAGRTPLHGPASHIHCKTARVLRSCPATGDPAEPFCPFHCPGHPELVSGSMCLLLCIRVFDWHIFQLLDRKLRNF